MSPHRPASRRSFLAASAGAVAAVPLSAARWPGAFAGEGTPETLNVAVVGAGGQGRHLMGEFARAHDLAPGVPGCRIAAVCDVDADRLRNAADLAGELNAAAGANGEVQSFADYQELLKKTGDLDAVVVATPDHRHAPPAVAAADAGLAVYCEKPLANTIEDCAAIRDAAVRNGVVCQVGTHERSNDKVRRACELVRGGALGEVRRVVLQMPVGQAHHRAVQAVTADTPRVPVPAALDYAAWLGDQTGPDAWPDVRAAYPELSEWMTDAGPHFWWRFVTAFGGGEMTDRGAHILDIAQLALGRDDADDWEPTEITATGTASDGFFDAIMDYEFRVDFPNGPAYTGTTEGPRGLRFEGEAGSLFVAVHGGATTADPPGLADATVDAGLGRVPSHRANFLSAVAGDAEPTAPVEAGYRTAVICHRVNAALRASS